MLHQQLPFESQVRQGMKLLDKHKPGWERKVDLSSLDLNSGAHCVLGQLYGEYENGVVRLLGKDIDLIYQSSDYGFFVRLGDPEDWSALTETWITLVKERFDAGNLSG